MPCSADLDILSCPGRRVCMLTFPLEAELRLALGCGFRNQTCVCERVWGGSLSEVGQEGDASHQRRCARHSRGLCFHSKGSAAAVVLLRTQLQLR
jgi:hypothetical protein